MKKRNNTNTYLGFTLIELLIVVAIIAILAAIAIPNFLAAQTRSKVARTLGEYKTITTGLESYYVDNNDYPPTRRPYYMTTPVAYISSMPKSPWKEVYLWATTPEFTTINGTYLYVSRWYIPLWGNDNDLTNDYAEYNFPNYAGANDPNVVKWELKSVGPDGLDDMYEKNQSRIPRACYYDPTNGTVSKGDIIWFSNGIGTGKGR